MPKSIRKYNNKTSKLKVFSRKRLYRKIYPSLLWQKIDNNFLTKNGITKESLLRDVYRLISCNNHISFIKHKKLLNNKVVDDIKIFNTNHCSIFTLCPICAEKISRRRRERHKEKIKYLALNSKYVYMVTFTTRDDPNFNISYNNLTDAIRKYVLLGQKREYGNSGGEASKIKAMAISKEIKIGKNSKNWHIHGHGIIFTDEKISYQIYDSDKRKKITQQIKKKYNRSPEKSELVPSVKQWGKIELLDSKTGIINNFKIPVSKASLEWLKVTNGTSTNIKFNPIKNPVKRVSPDEVYKQCLEIIKYTSKVSDFNERQIIEVLTNRKEKRFFSTYGDLYNYKKYNDDIDEEIELETVDLKGYVWSNRKDKLVPISKKDKARLVFRYENREKFKIVQSEILKSYYVKEKIIKNIVNEYRNSGGGTLISTINKEAVISNINSINNAYILHKKDIYKKHLGYNDTEKKRLKPVFLHSYFLKKLEVANK